MILRAIRLTTKSFLSIIIVASVALNIATVTISGVYTAVSSVASAAGLSTVAAREASNKLAARKTSREVVRKTSKRVSQRMAKGAARTTATSVGEAIPFVGVAVIAGGIALEVQDACDTARDMAGLEGAMANPDDPEAGQKQAMEQFDCTELIPNAEDLPDVEDIWVGMKSAPGRAWVAASDYIDDLPDIDIGGTTERLIVVAGERLEEFSAWVWGKEIIEGPSDN